MTSPQEALWRPAASLERLVGRAAILARIRAFFAARHILEVETPLLCAAPPAESHIQPIHCQHPLAENGCRHYLHTSPETAMKRLLAAGSGAIYQLCHTFRHGEAGALHNPEFTMLEWYRPHWGYRQLMDEVATLVGEILPIPPPLPLSFREAFQRWLGLDPHNASDAALERAAHGLNPPAALDRDGLLDFLLTTIIEPRLCELAAAVFLYDYPASRAAMAEIDPGPPATARRFELYVHGVELANGYQELTDPLEQSRRLTEANHHRQANGLPPLPTDHHFLEALRTGLPPCAGVALGVDRLVMLGLGARRLQEVMAFPADRL